MSIKKTKEQLLQLLKQTDNSVIALSGKWGTGKTHLWDDVKKCSNDEKVNKALYVSLFGLSSIEQVKRKLMEGAIPAAEENSSWLEGAKHIWDLGVKVVSEHYKALAALNDVNLLLMAPVVLRDKVIVIDDIERKHDNLGIDEVLGFIDEYSKQHCSRFILILNDDQLSTKDEQRTLWSTFREKVIDQEIKLSTSAEEAFSIAIGLKASKYSDSIKQASMICSLTNIRIICKIIKVVNQILADRNLDVATQKRVVPSIVLFSAIHYRGLNDGPDFKFALNIGNPDWAKDFRDNKEKLSGEEERERRWEGLMHELQIYGCDEFDKNLVEFLESGLLDTDSINIVIARYIAESEMTIAINDAKNYIRRVIWDHRASESELISESRTFQERAHLLDCSITTQLCSVIMELCGGEAITDKILDNWILGFRKRSSDGLNEENYFNNTVHPKIQAELDAIKASSQSSTTVLDACLYVYECDGWNTLQELKLGNAKVEDFELVIRETEDLEKLRKFMCQMLKMQSQRSHYDCYFGSATKNFIEACRKIVKDSEGTRLAKLVTRLFESNSLSNELEK